MAKASFSEAEKLRAIVLLLDQLLSLYSVRVSHDCGRPLGFQSPLSFDMIWYGKVGNAGGMWSL